MYFDFPPERKARERCTEGSLRSPSVQRAAAAPQLHKVLPPVALRTTAVLQNSEKQSSLHSILFRNFANPQRVIGHAMTTLLTLDNSAKMNKTAISGKAVFT